MTNVKTICVCLPVEQVEKLRADAAKLGISVSALVRVKLYTAEKSPLNSAYGMEVLHYGKDNS